MNRMLIDTTDVPSTKVILVAPIKEIIEHGKLHTSYGRRVAGLVIEGRSFSKFEKEALQYMLWNTFEITPPEDFKELVNLLKEKVGAMQADATSLDVLQKQTADIPPDYERLGITGKHLEAEPKPKRKSTAKPAGSRPGKGTATGIVWDVCDELTTELGRQPERKEVIAKCEHEGINKATASTQYGKWKKASN